MSDKPGLSVLIPWYERDELRLTLAANAPAFRAHEAEVLILNCGGNSMRLRELIAASEAPGVRQLDIAASRFNKSLALNIGLSYSRSDTVFTFDTDVVLLNDFVEEAKTLNDGQSFVTIDRRFESEPASFNSPQPGIVNKFVAALVTSSTLEFLFRDGATVQFQLSRQDIFGNKRANPGLLLAKKRDLLEIQGHNSDLESWGWEDNDVLVRLQYALGLQRVQKGSVLHLTHGDDRRNLQGSRVQSDRLNFLKCCRNYNNELFLGTYHADVAWAADKVTESVPNVVATGGSALVVRPSLNHIPTFMSGPAYCGNEDGVKPKRQPDGTERPPSIGQLLLEATLKKCSLQNHNVLYVEKYHGVVCNKYSQAFPGCLPLNAYDIIVDNNIASYACCQFHLKALMESYSKHLAPSGCLLTTQQGMEWSATDSCWKLSDADLASLAGQFGLGVTKTGYGVYTLRRMDQEQI